MQELQYDYKLGQQLIEEDIALYLSTKQYYEFVADELGCDIKDISLIQVHPDFEETDEEGWNFESFFPADSKIDVEILSRNFECLGDNGVCEYSFGEVVRIKYNGKIFIADHDASPIGCWGKFEK